MHSNTFLNTAGSIISKQRLNTNQNNSKVKPKSIMSKTKLYISPNYTRTRKTNYTNTSNFISTVLNNRSTTTNESSGINNSSYFHNNYRSFNPKIKKPHLNNVPINTVGTDKSTWYHTKTVASIKKEKQLELNMADEILKERKKRGLGGGTFGKKVSQVLEKSKEICLDNYMITQLREKRTEISKKEFFVEKALKRSEKQYEKDYRAFIDFVGDIKKKEKKEEEILNKLKNKKDQTEIKLNEELAIHKKLMEKCDMMIKIIILLKSYGSFVHKVFHADFIYDELSNSKLNYKNDIYLKDKIISLYEKSKKLPESYEEEINSILKYDESLMQQYSQYEEKLVKMLEDKNYIDKEITKMTLDYQNQMNILDKKLKEAQKEYSRLNFEKKGILSEMKEYVDQKPDDFRLLFMIDEVGQYVGDSVDLLMNLQSLVEKIGSECNGKIWVVCTGQEAIDEIIEALQTDIVHCEECEWWQKQDDSLQGRCAKYEFYPTGRYFCAGGERREE